MIRNCPLCRRDFAPKPVRDGRGRQKQYCPACCAKYPRYPQRLAALVKKREAEAEADTAEYLARWAAKPAYRTCLKHGGKFWSTHPSNRICPACHELSERYAPAPPRLTPCKVHLSPLARPLGSWRGGQPQFLVTGKE